MSPIIYTPHQCETPTLGDLPYGTVWQCETCQALWASTSASMSDWVKIEDPRREHRIEDASRRVPAQPTAPTVTARMVQLVLDTYSDHTERARDVFSGYTGCAVCGAGSYGPHTIRAHAREKAAEALQDVLDKAGESRG